MTHPISAKEDHARLSAVFAARRARLVDQLAHVPTRVVGKPAIATLQDYGYPLALSFAATAALPLVLRMLFRRKALLLKGALAIFRFRKVQRLIAPQRSTGRRS